VKIAYPGVHFSKPFISKVEEITIRSRTDTLQAINTVTRDGIENSFVGIQVYLGVI
jgi:hypothetical protein